MELYWYCIKNMEPQTYQQTLGMLDNVRRKHINDLPQEEERRRAVAAEWLVRSVLAEKLHCSPEEVPLRYDEDDKPYLEKGTLYVSLDYSGQYAVCAIHDKPVGVAVEVIRGAEEKFMRRVCSEQEFSYVRPYEEGGFVRFWECWTAKEALFRLTGKGPLVQWSRFSLAENQALDFVLKNDCALTVAMEL